MTRHLTFAPAALGTLAALALLSAAPSSWAQLPPPPVSPAPVRNFEYDAKGNPTKVIQAPAVVGFNFATTTTYDPLDRAKDTTNAKLGVTRFGYNGRDDLTQVTDPRNLITQYPRNGLGDATSLVSPDTGTATHTYDAAGNLLTRTDSRGVLATHAHDALNRLTSVVYSQAASSRTFTYTYDQTGPGFANGIGRLTSTAHPDGTGRFAYDAQGRLTTMTQVVNAATGANSAARTHVVGYGYDAAGRVTSITYPSGRVLAITYTGGQVSAMALRANATAAAVNMLTQVEWEPFGAAKGWLWQLTSGTSAHQRVFDDFGRLVRHRLGSVIRDITYDAADRITAYTHYDVATGAANTGLNQSFVYDELGRVTGITTSAGTWAIGYDATGNRTSVVLSGSTRVYTTAATSNRLTNLTNPAVTFTYDAAGNRTAGRVPAGTYTSTYSLENRLATLTRGTTTTTYTYDAAGQRVRKYGATVGSTVIFVYDQGGKLLGEYSNTGAALREFVWLGDEPVAVFTPNGSNPPNIFYVHSDHLGAPRAVLNKSEQLRWRWMAEPFGTTAAENNPQALGAFTFNLRMPGQVFDSESGLFYNYFRDYEGVTGRYVQSDPIGLAGGINTYSYVGGNPLNYVDPTGEAGTLVWCLGGPGGCAAGVAAAGWAIWMSTPGGQDAVRQAATPSSDTCEPGDPERCAKAKHDAQSRYWKLTTKRIPQYRSGGTRGPDADHYASILQLQQALKDAIRRVRLYCRPLPAEITEWERAANEYIAPRH